MREHSEAADALKVAADAVSGPDTPNAAQVVAQPARAPLWALLGAGPALTAVLCWIIWILAYKAWPEAVAESRVQMLGAIALAMAGILGLVVFRLASGNLKRFEARAGPGSISIDTGG